MVCQHISVGPKVDAEVWGPSDEVRIQKGDMLLKDGRIWMVKEISDGFCTIRLTRGKKKTEEKLSVSEAQELLM